MLLLQEFDVIMIDRPGKSNVVVDYLSRLNNPGEVIPVDDDFPDEHLFSMSAKSPWFTDIANYLVTGKHHLNYSFVKRGISLRKVLHILGYRDTSFTIDHILLFVDV